MLGFNSLSYKELAEFGSAILRCFYYNVSEQDPNMRNFNHGKAFGYTLVLSKLGYTNLVQPIKDFTWNEKRWIPIWTGNVNSYDERGEYESVIFMRKELFEDALEHIRTSKIHSPSYEGLNKHYAEFGAKLKEHYEKDTSST